MAPLNFVTKCSDVFAPQGILTTQIPGSYPQRSGVCPNEWHFFFFYKLPKWFWGRWSSHHMWRRTGLIKTLLPLQKVLSGWTEAITFPSGISHLPFWLWEVWSSKLSFSITRRGSFTCPSQFKLPRLCLHEWPLHGLHQCEPETICILIRDST